MVSKRILLALAFVILAALLGGCKETSLQQAASADPAKNGQQVSNAGSQNDPSNATSQEKMIITVYNANKDATHLVGEVHVVPKTVHPAQTAMELLAAGTKQVDLVSVMPAGTKLLHLSIKDNIAYVDFNHNLIKNNSGGSTSELLLVGAIVNTLTEFHEIQKVQIMVEGKKIETISGHMDTSEPLARSEKMIKK